MFLRVSLWAADSLGRGNANPAAYDSLKGNVTLAIRGPNPTVTNDQLKIHFIAIGGTGMAPLACLLQELGHRVTGSDGPLYPPMSTLLERAGIRPEVGFDPRHLSRGGTPDLVIVGNAVHRSNPEAQEAEALGLERISMPQAIARFLLPGRRPLVVAGTHGKTTTTSLATWVYAQAGLDPSYLIGGVPRNLGRSFRLGAGDRFIIEGDEYNASYFDRGAKFLHYRPETLVLTSVEYDHTDLYPDFESLRRAFRKAVRLLPPQGSLIAWGDHPEVRAAAREAACPVTFYGLEEGNDLRPVGGAAGIREDVDGCRFRLQTEEGPFDVHLGLSGRHNVLNSLAVWAAARRDGLGGEAVAAAFSSFLGARGRLEELGTAGGVTVVHDFAHHPTAVAATLMALRGRYPGRPLTALFEPRSLSAGRRLFHSLYLEAFAYADRVFLAPIYHRGRLSPEEVLDREALAGELAQSGTRVTACASIDELCEEAVREAAPGDLLVTMSSGAFEGLPRRLLEGLGSAHGARPGLPDEVPV